MLIKSSVGSAPEPLIELLPFFGAHSLVISFQLIKTQKCQTNGKSAEKPDSIGPMKLLPIFSVILHPSGWTGKSDLAGPGRVGQDRQCLAASPISKRLTSGELSSHDRRKRQAHEPRPEKQILERLHKLQSKGTQMKQQEEIATTRRWRKNAGLCVTKANTRHRRFATVFNAAAASGYFKT